MRDEDATSSHPGEPRRVVAVALGTLALFALLATVAAAQDDDRGGDERDLVSQGNDLYGQWCVMCHGVEGGGSDVAPAIGDASPALVDFVLRTGRMPILHPEAPVRRSEPRFDERGREALVAYVRTWAADEPEIPDPDPDAGEIAHGREIYETHCIACHTPFGDGIAVSQRDLAPALHDADAVEIAEAVRAGPGVMPRFSEVVIDEHDLDSVITYVTHLRERPQPGGLTFGRSGPVSEGLLAWIFGVGALLVAVYFIGERRAD